MAESVSCMWDSCARTAEVALLVGDISDVRPHGVYCVLHSVVRAQTVRAEHRAETWYDEIRSERDLPGAVSDPAGRRRRGHHALRWRRAGRGRRPDGLDSSTARRDE